jgi:hypothetical protein
LRCQQGSNLLSCFLGLSLLLLKLFFLLSLLLYKKLFLFFDFILLFFDLKLLLFGLVQFIKHDLEPFSLQTLELLILLQIVFDQSALKSVPSLPGILVLLVLFKELADLFLNRFLGAIRIPLHEVINDLLFAFKGTMHQLDKLD